MIPVHALKKNPPQLRHREWNFQEVDARICSENDQNTEITTNDRTRNTKLLLVRSFVANLVFLATFWSKYANQLPEKSHSRFLNWGEFFYLMYGFTFSGDLRRVQRFGPISHPEITLFLDFPLKRKAKWRPERTWGNHLSPSHDPFWGHFWGPGGGLEITKSQKPQKFKIWRKSGF